MKTSASLFAVIIILVLMGTGCKREPVQACLNVNWLDASGMVLVNDTLTFVCCGGEVNFCHWDFGDGTTADGSEIKHAFASAGTFTVNLRQYDDKNSDGKSVVITAVAISASDFAGTFNAVQYCANSSDSTIYVTTITTAGADSIAIFNLHNNAMTTKAGVIGNYINIPPQILGTDTIGGSGLLKLDRSILNVDMGISSGTYQYCSVRLTRQ